MWKDKNLNIAYAFHLMMMVIFVFVIVRHQGNTEKAQIGKIKQKMVGVANTFSVLPGRHVIAELVRNQELPPEQFADNYAIAAGRLQDVLDANEMGDFELSIIQYEPTQKRLYRLVSSSAMYSLGEDFHDLDGKLLERFNLGHVELVNHDNGIQKAYAFQPLKDSYGGTLGVVRVESDDLSARIAQRDKSFWYYLLIVIYGIAAAIMTPRMLKKRGHLKLERSQEAITKELRQKNKELKMLSLVAKKSKNLMLITDREGTVLWVNETYENKNNFSADELNTFVGKFLPEISKNENIRNIIRNVVKFKEPTDYESQSLDENGATFYALTTVTPVLDDQGEVQNLLFVDTDITRLKQVETENESFRVFAEKCAEPRIHMSREGKVLFNNSSADQLLQRWMSPGGKSLKPDIAIMLRGICDARKAERFEFNINEQRVRVDIHPDPEGQSMFILAEQLNSYGFAFANIKDNNQGAG